MDLNDTAEFFLLKNFAMISPSLLPFPPLFHCTNTPLRTTHSLEDGICQNESIPISHTNQQHTHLMILKIYTKNKTFDISDIVS